MHIPRPTKNASSISITYPILWSALVVLAISAWQWPRRWLLSGTPIFSFLLLLGASNGYRVLSFIPLWTIIATLNLAYSVASTSWLLYGVFTALMIPTILLTCILQFDVAARLVRRALRKTLRELQIVHDTIALFDVPALEIDVDVDGLMVIRGLTISLSTLTVVAHGIEVGIKLTSDMELAISAEKCTVRLFRGVIISDCFANIKGGDAEVSIGEIEETDSSEDAIIVESTPMLRAVSRPKMIKHMTGGVEMQDSAAKAGWRSMRKLSPDETLAGEQYDKMLKHIQETNDIQKFRAQLQAEVEDRKDLRAAICSKLHDIPTVPHPPKRSIKVTTLQNLSKPRTRKFLHRMPFLLRLLLNPIAYLHPVEISSITAAGSGRFISLMLKRHLFKQYSEDSKDLRKLEKRVLSWLADANFVFELSDITGLASVPINPTFDIISILKFGDVIAYRSSTELEQVIRLGGADATFNVPSYLLPHHEHLLPPVPTSSDKQALSSEINEADGKPEKVQAERKLDQAEKDETNVTISAHIQLPACFSQDLLNFIAALVKASKVVEMEKDGNESLEKLSGFKALSQGMKDSMKRTVVDGVVSDKWIAKMVGKVTRKLEGAQGDVGYTGDIPVKLEKYRLPEGHPELSKLLP